MSLWNQIHMTPIPAPIAPRSLSYTNWIPNSNPGSNIRPYFSFNHKLKTELLSECWASYHNSMSLTLNASLQTSMYPTRLMEMCLLLSTALQNIL